MKTIQRVMCMGALVAAMPTYTIGFIANRYLVDLLPLLLLGALPVQAETAMPTEAQCRQMVESMLRTMRAGWSPSARIARWAGRSSCR